MQLNRWRVVVTLALSVLACDKAGAEPELHIIPQQGLAHPNQAYRVTLEVTWSGGASDYAILPAEMDPIDWGTMTIRAARAFVRDAGNGESQNVVSQTLEFVPNKVGEFTTPAIRVFYLNPGATPPAEKVDHGTAPPDSSASPSLGAEPFTIVVRPARTTLFWISGGLGASLLLTAVGWWSVHLLHRRQPTLYTGGSVPASQTVQFTLHRARQHRLDGKFYEYYVELARAAEQLPPAGQPGGLAAALKARAQEVGYKGVRPTDDAMDGDFREIERALTRCGEDAQL